MASAPFGRTFPCAPVTFTLGLRVTLGLPPEDAMAAWLWASRLWPIVLPVLMVTLAPRAGFVAFVVLGALICFGMQSLVGAFSVELPASIPEHGSLEAKVLAVSVAHIARTLFISVVLSVPMLLWFRKLLQTSTAQGRHT
jgi:hypothetical protein